MKLKELRLSSGYNQNEVANNINITQNTYSNYENNKTEPDIETLCKLADYYGVSLDYLCEHTTNNVLDLSNYSDSFKQLIRMIINFTESQINMLIGSAIRISQEI